MRELVDQDESRTAQQCRVEIEFVEVLAPIRHRLRRQDLQVREQRRCFGAAVSLDDPDDDVSALGAEFARGHQHGVGLAHAGGGAEIDPQLTAARLGLLTLDLRQQEIGIGALFAQWRHLPLLCAI